MVDRRDQKDLIVQKADQKELMDMVDRREQKDLIVQKAGLKELMDMGQKDMT